MNPINACTDVQYETEINRLRTMLAAVQQSEARHVEETRRLRAENERLKAELEIALETSGGEGDWHVPPPRREPPEEPQ